MHPHYNFSAALAHLKQFGIIQRKGWNGKGMYLFYVPSDGYLITKMTKHPDHTGLENSAFIAMKTADNKVVPWLASQTDILAEDWLLLDASDVQPGQSVEVKG